MPDEIMPRDRAELLWNAIINHTIEAVDAIRDRPELIAAAIAAGLPDMLGDPRDRYEMFLKAIAGAQGGGGIDDSITGWTVLYNAENLTFRQNGTGFTDTGIAILSNTYADKDIKVIVKGAHVQGQAGYQTLLSCQDASVDGTPGFKVGTGGTVGAISNNNIWYNGSTTIDFDFVFSRIDGVYNCEVGYPILTANSGLLITVPKCTGTFANERHLVLGGSLTSDGNMTNMGNATIASIIIAIK